ncbi:iron chelate uptake ABC transporter family permease subunit [Paenibacillus hexagrammi]|uniref:iron chelate uptake ABC transporter family permease subunit n=1 Tax=Paenibacillus hexagrammi TaxID=2908839 RepID=UPI0028833471|nr:iron chelate uptake ABC transporter family permease subunit [Paenibacillus sp. YPD9-1]
MLLVLAIASIRLGTVSVSFRDIWASLLHEPNKSMFIVNEIRLPRMFTGILAGFGLAAGGVILQSLVRNPLASPDVIGITKGAGFTAATVIFLFPKAPNYMLPAAAFVGAFAAFIILLLVSRRLTLAPASLALVGVAVGALFQAGTQYLIVNHPTDINMALLWMAGSLWGRRWDHVLSLLPWMAVLLPIVWRNYAKLDILQLGDETVTSLGVRIARQRFWLLLLAVSLAGISVSAVGAIGFVGLIAPHISRRIVGSRHQWLIPLAALIGADLMLFGDCLGRILIIPREVLLGAKVRDLRKQHGLSEEQLGEKTGFKFSYIGSLERGEANISLKNRKRQIAPTML